VDSLPVVAWPCGGGAAAHVCCPRPALETCEGRASAEIGERVRARPGPPHVGECRPSSRRAKRRVDARNVLVVEIEIYILC
jgi:hypothetical protein